MSSLNLLNIAQVLVAVALIGFILIQRGPGATAGSGLGGGGGAGASGTVFGAKGSGSFLTKATAILATLFFIITMIMAIQAREQAGISTGGERDLGVMGSLTEEERSDVPSISGGATDQPVNVTVPEMSKEDEPISAAAETVEKLESGTSAPQEGEEKDKEDPDN